MWELGGMQLNATKLDYFREEMSTGNTSSIQGLQTECQKQLKLASTPCPTISADSWRSKKTAPMDLSYVKKIVGWRIYIFFGHHFAHFVGKYST
jgi:hypothetical protein